MKLECSLQPLSGSFLMGGVPLLSVGLCVNLIIIYSTASVLPVCLLCHSHGSSSVTFWALIPVTGMSDQHAVSTHTHTPDTHTNILSQASSESYADILHTQTHAHTHTHSYTLTHIGLSLLLRHPTDTHTHIHTFSNTLT